MVAFESEILDALRPRIGDRLHGVEYGDHCDDEFLASYPLDDSDLALEGGVLLHFEGGDLQLEPCGLDDWVVRASSESGFGDHLRSFDARDLPYWRSFVGEPLVSASVLSLEGEPTAILLNFSTSSVLVWVAGGEGSMYVSWPSSKSYLSDLETLWTSDEPDVMREPELKGALIDDRAQRGFGEVPMGVSCRGVATGRVLGRQLRAGTHARQDVVDFGRPGIDSCATR